MRRSLTSVVLLLALAAPAGAGEAIAFLMVRNSPLAGFRYNDGRLVWNDLKAGDELRLVREYDNPHDADAIRLEWNGRKIGYVPRQENRALARELDAGKRIDARIVELARRRNGRHLIGYDILVPLQAARETLKDSK
ncbi:MAG: HIRAN domain-containing protein [Burkholderiales bacterium]